MRKSKYKLEEQPNWRWWVTPKPLAEKPVHRWYVFPHSFTQELVWELIDEWELSEKDRVLDPFVGAGTTLLAAKERGVPATGYDLSPLAVLASKVKTGNFRFSHLEKAWGNLKRNIEPSRWNGASRTYPELIRKALPGRLLGAFDTISNEISALGCSEGERNFFRLAMFSILPKYSRAEATGGWLKWMEKHTNVRSLPATFSKKVETMLEDLERVICPKPPECFVGKADARRLPDAASTYSAVITSPPYPNRHDYTRVFGVELMFGFLDWEKTRRLRYQSFHSHPEAYPVRPETNGYSTPRSLVRAIGHLKRLKVDPRVPAILEGYFLDMYICLREIKRVCRAKANIALVVGNAQYGGMPILVDQITAEIGEQAGLTCEKLVVARYRGNSAQQMNKYGRKPSRESIVCFRKM